MSGGAGARARKPNPRYMDTPLSRLPAAELERHIQSVRQEKEKIEREISQSVRARQPSTRGPVPVRALSATQGHSRRPLLPKPDLSALRKDVGLVEKASQMVDSVWIDSSSDEETHLVKVKGSKKLKSGMEAKSVDGVKLQLVWPHSQLQYQFINRSYTYKELNLPLFVAGELEVLTSPNIDHDEFLSRLELLKILAYESNLYPIKAILEWHASFLHRVETGRAGWDQNPYAVGQAILCRYKPEDKSFKSKVGKPGASSSGGSKAPSKPNLLFCSAYNRNKCTKQSPHEAVIKGKNVTVNHFCAACLLKKSNQVQHPECSEDCPLFQD